jgi:hypothetical protein
LRSVFFPMASANDSNQADDQENHRSGFGDFRCYDPDSTTDPEVRVVKIRL